MKFKDVSPSVFVEERIRLQIKTKDDGEQLASQRELASEFNVSRNAVKHALIRLQQEGKIRVKNRKGIKVNKKIDVNLLGMASLSDELNEERMEISHLSTKVVNVPENLSSFFESSVDELAEIKRLRFYNGSPFSLEIAYLDNQKFTSISEIDFTGRSLYRTLKDKYDVVPTYGYENITCVLADEFLSKMLEVELNKPLYRVDSFNYEDNDILVEHAVQFLSGSNFKYHFRAKNIFDYQEDEDNDII